MAIKNILILIILVQTTNSFTINTMPGISMLNNKLKNNPITTITKDNAYKFIKRGSKSTTQNILNFVTTPDKILLERLKNKIAKITLAADKVLITKINESKDNFKEKFPEIIRYINEEIKKIYPNAKIPLAKLGQKLEKESKKLNKYNSQINYLLEKNNKLKSNDFSHLETTEILINKINKLQQNIDTIANFLNTLF